MPGVGNHRQFKDSGQREFEKRLLAALERPKAHWFIRIINSASFLWLRSVIFLSIGGSLFTGYSQCSIDANQQIEQYHELARETDTRIRYIMKSVIDATTAAEIQTALDHVPL